MIARNKPASPYRIRTKSQALPAKIVGILSVFTFLTVQFYAGGPSGPRWMMRGGTCHGTR